MNKKILLALGGICLLIVIIGILMARTLFISKNDVPPSTFNNTGKPSVTVTKGPQANQKIDAYVQTIRFENDRAIIQLQYKNGDTAGTVYAPKDMMYKAAVGDNQFPISTLQKGDLISAFSFATEQDTEFNAVAIIKHE